MLALSIYCELAQVQGGVVGGVEPVYAIYDLPMYYGKDIYKGMELYDGTRSQVLKPIDDRYGITELLTFWFPPQRFHAKYPVVDWDSLKGKKIRTWTAEQALLIELMGGIPQSIAWGEVSTALATGLVSGAITSSGSAYDAGFYDYVDTQTLFEIQFAHSQITVNSEALAELDEDTRNIVLEQFREFEVFVRQGNISDGDRDVIAAIMNTHATVVAPSDKFWLEVREAAATGGVWDDWKKRAGAEGEQALKVIDEAMQRLGMTE